MNFNYKEPCEEDYMTSRDTDRESTDSDEGRYSYNYMHVYVALYLLHCV